MKSFAKKKQVLEKFGFDIKKYDVAYQLKMKDWANQLTWRYMFYHTYNTNKDSFCYLTLLYSIFAKPISIVDGKLFLDGLKNSIYDLKLVDVCEISEELNISDAMAEVRETFSSYKDYWSSMDALNNLQNQTVEKTFIEVTGYTEFLKSKASYKDCDEYIKVSLEFSDELLINDFKDWLKGKRAAQKSRDFKKKAITNVDFKRWADLKVLAYLDIQMFCEHTETKLTDYNIGELLYPDSDVDVAEKVRKTLKPLAKKLFTNDFIQQLINHTSKESE